MIHPPKFIAMPRRLSISLKLGAAILLLAMLAGGNLYLSERMYDSIVDTAGIINQSGRLRYLSQQIALHSAGFVLEPGAEAGHRVREGETVFERHYARLAATIGQLPRAMRNADDGLDARMGRIQVLRLRQHLVLERMLETQDSTVRQTGQHEVLAAASGILQEADQLVSTLEAASISAHRRVDFAIHSMQMVEFLLVLGLFFYLHKHITAPLLALTGFTRRFAAGERTLHMDFHSNDELGELVQSFNTATGRISSLLDDLDHRARENAVLAGILEATVDIVITVAPDGRVLYLNHAGRKMLGLTEDEAVDDYRLTDFYSVDAALSILHTALPIAQRAGVWSGEGVLRSRPGLEIPVSQVIIAHKAADGTLDYYSSIMRDTVLFKMLERRLQDSLDFHLKLLQEFPNPIWRVGRDGKCDYVNHAWLEFTGRTEEDELGDGWADNIHPEDRERCLGTYLFAFNRREPFAMEYRMRHRDGSYHWLLDHGAPYTDLDGEFAGYLGTCYDINARKQYEFQLEYQSQHDALTGLPNRNLLADRLGQAISRVRRQGQLVGVLFLDLDNFKIVNDSLGHDIGDHLLKAVSERLTTVVREGDTVARHGGDEFVIVLADMVQEEDVVNATRKLLATMAAPFKLDGRDQVATVSVGVAICPRDGEDQATLLRNADTALYRAKDAGRNTFRFYAADMNQRLLERLNLEGDLHQALERDEFLLHYQPQVDLASGVITGAEALVRWHHPVRGIVSPAEFIPLTEETGLIVPLGIWILREACRQTMAWREAGLPELHISVNLSARQFHSPDLPKTILDVLAETGLEARLLELEITESMVMHDPEDAIAVLDELEKHGIRFAVDDFGTGYSSLNYLKRFPIHKLKIDQSFVRNITTDPEDAAITTAVIELAHSLKLKVIAEGVETEEQRAFLRARQCDEMQGYFFSRPLPATEMDALLIANKQLLAAPVVENEETRTLLLVDDEENILNTLYRLLRRDGYHILRTTSPREALKLLARHTVGVVVSDQRMPEMQGVDFLRKVKEIHPDTVRIVLSGYTELKSVTDAINEGAVYKFITKPWDENALRDDVRAAFQHYEIGRENQRLSARLAGLTDQLDRSMHSLELRAKAQNHEVAQELDLLRASQAVLEGLPMGVIGVMADGRITAANRVAEELLGVPADTLRGGAEHLPTVMRTVLDDTFAGRTIPAANWRAADGREVAFSCRRQGEDEAIVIMTPM